MGHAGHRPLENRVDPVQSDRLTAGGSPDNLCEANCNIAKPLVPGAQRRRRVEFNGSRSLKTDARTIA
jgi:hypothetical protein